MSRRTIGALMLAALMSLPVIATGITEGWTFAALLFGGVSVLVAWGYVAVRLLFP